VCIKRMIVSSISTKFRKIDIRKIEWKIPNEKRHDVDKRYHFQDHKDVLDFTSHTIFSKHGFYMFLMMAFRSDDKSQIFVQMTNTYC
jgi:hypothetical protein